MLWVLAITYNVLRFFEFTVAEVETESGRVLTTKGTAMYKNNVYHGVYSLCLYFVLRNLLPLAALVFFNERLVHVLHESNQLRHHSTTDSTRRQQTWMLVVVVIVFAVCQLPTPAVIATELMTRYAIFPFSLSVMWYAIVTGNLMLVVNSSTNVVIYCFVGRQFRAILPRMIGCGGERHNAGIRNLEMDPECPAVLLHHVPTTPHPPEQSQSGRESPMSRHSAGDDAVC